MPFATSVVEVQTVQNNRLHFMFYCRVFIVEFQKIYDRLDVKLTERGESFYQDLMIEAVKFLEAGGFLELDNGRKIMFAPNLQVPLTVVKSDGGFTYDTSDMAAIRHRIEEEKGDWLVYVTDLGQAGHFETIFGCAEKVGWLDRSRVRVDHVGKRNRLIIEPDC